MIYMEEKKLNEIEFIKKTFINEFGRLQEQGFHYVSIMLMAQGIETLGSFLDDKPFRAERQSSKRFSLAINRLFPKQYRKANNNYWLYNKLRNHMAHMFVPSSFLILCTTADKPEGKTHLSYDGEKMIIIAEDFYLDFKSACEKLIKKIDNKEVSSKKIGSNFLSFGDSD